MRVLVWTVTAVLFACGCGLYGITFWGAPPEFVRTIRDAVGQTENARTEGAFFVMENLMVFVGVMFGGWLAQRETRRLIGRQQSQIDDLRYELKQERYQRGIALFETVETSLSEAHTSIASFFNDNDSLHLGLGRVKSIHQFAMTMKDTLDSHARNILLEKANMPRDLNVQLTELTAGFGGHLRNILDATRNIFECYDEMQDNAQIRNIRTVPGYEGARDALDQRLRNARHFLANHNFGPVQETGR